MKLRAVIRIRHDAILAAREKTGLSQKELAHPRKGKGGKK